MGKVENIWLSGSCSRCSRAIHIGPCRTERHITAALLAATEDVMNQVAVRCKFNVYSVAQNIGPDGAVESETVNIGAVYGPEGTENNTFWKATPSAQLEMTITNPAAFGTFRRNKQFYVDFTPAD